MHVNHIQTIHNTEKNKYVGALQIYDSDGIALKENKPLQQKKRVSFNLEPVKVLYT